VTSIILVPTGGFSKYHTSRLSRSKPESATFLSNKSKVCPEYVTEDIGISSLPGPPPCTTPTSNMLFEPEGISQDQLKVEPIASGRIHVVVNSGVSTIKYG